MLSGYQCLLLVVYRYAALVGAVLAWTADRRARHGAAAGVATRAAGLTDHADTLPRRSRRAGLGTPTRRAERGAARLVEHPAAAPAPADLPISAGKPIRLGLPGVLLRPLLLGERAVVPEYGQPPLEARHSGPDTS